jgi:hypothetical protein
LANRPEADPLRPHLVGPRGNLEHDEAAVPS